MRLLRKVTDAAHYKILTIKPLTGALGALIEGVDLSKPLNAAARAEIIQALNDHLVIYFHDQNGFTRERHIDFAKLFGPLQKIPHIFSVEGYPDVQVVRREPGETRRYVGEGFHADSTFLKTPPTTVMKSTCLSTGTSSSTTVPAPAATSAPSSWRARSLTATPT